MTEDDQKLTEIQGEAFQQRPGDPEVPELTPEQIRESAHGTIWYCVGTGDYNVLRMTLLQQDPETLRDWDEQASRLRDEIRRALIWHES